MLVRFTSPAGASVSMFQKDASALIRLMGHSGTIPSAIRGEDVATYLQHLETALAAQAAEAQPDPDTRENHQEKDHVSINVRAYPLLQLLKAAAEQHKMVMWEFEHPVL